MITISRRGLVRIISFAVAIIASFSILLYNSQVNAANAKLQIKYGYTRAVEDLCASLDSIKNTLNKGMYSNSPRLMSELSGRLWSDASAAKVALAQLPVDELDLSNTYKFLSQVGNYSKSLSQKYSGGEELTAEDKENILQLYDYAKTVSDNLWNVENQLQSGFLTFEKVKEIAEQSEESGNMGAQPHISDGFKDIEEGFQDYPMLIYDGPFSDHIMQKEPLMLKEKEDIDQAAAYRIAAQVSGINGLTLTGEESDKMPSYLFTADNATVSITKAGGMFCYMLNYRGIDDVQLSVEMAIDAADKYLQKLGMENMAHNYYEIQQGVCIINFTAKQDDITLYTDLAKVGVAMDNGEIISFDARGYLTNHTEREIKEPALTVKEASMKVSPYLVTESTRLCVIPTEGLNEKYCYEFKCHNSNGQQILVYINADTGDEEKILLLQIDKNGMLTV